MTVTEISKLAKGDLVKFFYDALKEEFWCLAVVIEIEPDGYDRFKFYMGNKVMRYGTPSLRMYAEAL